MILCGDTHEIGKEIRNRRCESPVRSGKGLSGCREKEAKNEKEAKKCREFEFLLYT